MQRSQSIVALFATVALASPTHAQESDTLDDRPWTAGSWHLALNGVSKHFNVASDYAKQGLNERNWGLGFQYDLPHNGKPWYGFLNGGGYHDTSSGTALYAGGGAMFDLYRQDGWQAGVGVQAALFHSERYNEGRAFVALFPVANLGHERVSLNIAVIPRIRQFIDAGVVFFQLKAKLGE